MHVRTGPRSASIATRIRTAGPDRSVCRADRRWTIHLVAEDEPFGRSPPLRLAHVSAISLMPVDAVLFDVGNTAHARPPYDRVGG